ESRGWIVRALSSSAGRVQAENPPFPIHHQDDWFRRATLGFPALRRGSPVKKIFRSVRSMLRDWFGRRDPFAGKATPQLEPLEDRWVPAAMVFTVMNAMDEVNGGDNSLSLREAIQAANANPGEDTIKFKSSLSGANIQLSMGEIPITESVIIKGLGK